MSGMNWPWIWAHAASGSTHVLITGDGGPAPAGHTLCGMVRGQHAGLVDGKLGALCARCRRSLDKCLRAMIDHFDPVLQRGTVRPEHLDTAGPAEPAWAQGDRKLLDRIEFLELAILEIAPGKLEALWGNPAPRP